MTFSIAHNNFSGGELSPTLSARYDVAKYAPGCFKMQNFIAQLHGGARYRPGTYMIEEMGAPGIVVPFQFNSRDTHTLVLTDKAMRIVDGWGWIKKEENSTEPLIIETPWLTEDLYDLHYKQIGDIIYFVHENYPVQKIMRTGLRDWKVVEVKYTSDITPPVKDLAGVWNGQTEGSYTLNYKIASVSVKGEVSVGSETIEVKQAYPNGDWVKDDHVVLEWSPVEGADSYNIYREEAGYFGLVGVVTKNLKAPEKITFRDDNFKADTTDGIQEGNNPFKENYPSTLCFHNQRLHFAASKKEPTKWWGSQVGNFENFNKSRPLQDDDLLEFVIASGKQDKIQWVESFGELLIGTEGAEYKVSGGDGRTITPVSIDSKKQSSWGSARLQPIVVGTSVLHVQRQQSRVRDLFFSLEVDGYSGNDLSILAEHLFDGYTIKQWAYQQAPDSVIWAVRSDGVLLGMTYLKEHQIWGWHRHVTDGEFVSVAAVGGANGEDEVFFVVKRTINGSKRYFVEKLMPKWRESNGIKGAFFVDCGRTYKGDATNTISGLDHLEGRDVVACADGAPIKELVVRGGEIKIPFLAKEVHVGLPYTGILSPLPPEGEVQGGSTLGKMRGQGPLTIRLHESVGGEYAKSEDSEFFFIKNSPSAWGQAVPPKSADVQVSPPPGYDTHGRIVFKQDYPLPMTIVAIAQEISYGRR